MHKKTNALYAQSGGVTAVINASASGYIQKAQERPEINKVLVAKNGILGVLEESIFDLSTLSDANISLLSHTPGGGFGSCRYKLNTENTEEKKRLLEVFEAHNIGYFFYNGGGDSADTCLKISNLTQEANYPLKVIHIPKTIDNDLPFTDNSPGFGSAAKYIAISTLETALDVASMARSSTKVFILEVMGRHAGWLAAAAGLAPTPSVILFPERPFYEEKMFAKVSSKISKHGFCSVIVSEGVKTDRGQFLASQSEVDRFGHQQLGGAAPIVAARIKQTLGVKTHWAVADYLQRSAAHIISATDHAQARAIAMDAVSLALRGESKKMTTIIREQNNPYKWTTGQALLSQIANVEKKMPNNYISSSGFEITPACREYLTPLIKGELYPPYFEGLPTYFNTDWTPVKRRCRNYDNTLNTSING